MEALAASDIPTFLRIAMCGESNSGKTYSALLLAQTLGVLNETILVDAENRGELYSKIFPGYKVIKIKPPFTPEAFGDALKKCVDLKAKMVILDSPSEAWDNITDEQKKFALTKPKLAYYSWGTFGPRWKTLRDTINHAPFHVISCWRMKDKLVTKEENGEKVMVQDGQRAVARGGNKGIKYDYQIVFVIDENHRAKIGKDNLHLFVDWKEGQIIDKSVGERIKGWLKPVGNLPK